jgi:hypothetical protein
MDDKYEILNNGIIKQKNVAPIDYNYEYSSKYNNYGEKGNYLAYLRLGVLLGVLGKSPDSIIDIGYGNGSFLNACVGAIKHVYGSDISDYPVPNGVTKIKFEDIPNVTVACFFDSLEHFSDIYQIKSINAEYFFVSVPWCNNTSEEYFMNWYHRRENEHIYHFSDKSLIAFFKEIGYECIYISSFEDIIRKNDKIIGMPNILSCVFKRK